MTGVEIMSSARINYSRGVEQNIEGTIVRVLNIREVLTNTSKDAAFR